MTNQKGFLSIVAIILIVVISFICMAATYQFVSDTRQATNSLASSQAFYMAQSGIEGAKHALDLGTVNCASLNGNANFTNATFTGAAGTFTVTGSLAGNQCTLTSVGGVPDLITPTGKRTIQAVFTRIGIASSAFMATGAVTLSGNTTIRNLSVTSSSPDFAGSTVHSSGLVSINGSACTNVSDFNPSCSSSSGTLRSDIVSNDTSLNSSTLFNQFFTQSKAAVEADTNTDVESNDNHLNGLVGKTVWVNSDVNLNGNKTIGTATNPVILIINGDLNINGNVTVYGLVYVIGNTSNTSLSGNLVINGAIVSEGYLNTSSGSSEVNFDSSILTALYSMNPNTVLHYSNSPTSMKEIIP